MCVRSGARARPARAGRRTDGLLGRGDAARRHALVGGERPGARRASSSLHAPSTSSPSPTPPSARCSPPASPPRACASCSGAHPALRPTARDWRRSSAGRPTRSSAACSAPPTRPAPRGSPPWSTSCPPPPAPASAGAVRGRTRWRGPDRRRSGGARGLRRRHGRRARRLDLLCDLPTTERLGMAVARGARRGTPAVAVACGGSASSPPTVRWRSSYPRTACDAPSPAGRGARPAGRRRRPARPAGARRARRARATHGRPKRDGVRQLYVAALATAHRIRIRRAWRRAELTRLSRRNLAPANGYDLPQSARSRFLHWRAPAVRRARAFEVPCSTLHPAFNEAATSACCCAHRPVFQEARATTRSSSTTTAARRHRGGVAPYARALPLTVLRGEARADRARRSGAVPHVAGLTRLSAP
jgi:hypothetical protein